MPHNARRGNAKPDAVRIDMTFDVSLYIRLGNRARKMGMATGEEWAAAFVSSSFLPDNIAPTHKGKTIHPKGRKIQW